MHTRAKNLGWFKLDLNTGYIQDGSSYGSSPRSKISPLSPHTFGLPLWWQPTLAYLGLPAPKAFLSKLFCETTRLYNIFSFDSTPPFSKEAFGTLPIPPLGRHFILIVLLPQSKMGDRAPDALVTLLSVPRGNEYHGFDRVNCLL